MSLNMDVLFSLRKSELKPWKNLSLQSEENAKILAKKGDLSFSKYHALIFHLLSLAEWSDTVDDQILPTSLGSDSYSQSIEENIQRISLLVI